MSLSCKVHDEARQPFLPAVPLQQLHETNLKRLRKDTKEKRSEGEDCHVGKVHGTGNDLFYLSLAAAIRTRSVYR